VLRTQVDVVLPSGAAVLNAADPQVVEMADLCDGEVIFYGVDEQLAAIAAHRKDGKRVVFQRADCIVMADGRPKWPACRCRRWCRRKPCWPRLPPAGRWA
jgi:cyanophycin synthetase